MKTKDEIVKNWLTRYTGTELEDFGKYILLTNFQNYVDIFAEMNLELVNLLTHELGVGVRAPWHFSHNAILDICTLFDPDDTMDM